MGKGWIYLVSLALLIESIIGRGVRMENQIGNSFLKEEIEIFAKEVKEQILAFDWKGLSEKKEAVEEQRIRLSMEEVLTFADLPKDFLVLNEELQKYWIHDVKKDLDEKTYASTITYSIWYQEEEYLLDIVYRKKTEELECVCLTRVSDGEAIFLYDTESAYRKSHLANREEVEAYLEKHKQISDYFSAEIPENLTVEPYHAQIGYGGGSCLVSSDASDNAYLEELMVYAEREKLPLPIEYYSIGGMCCYNDCIDWEGEHISHSPLGAIHSYPMEEGENLEGCEVPARLVMMGQDLFTTVFLDEAEKKYGEIPQEKQVVRQWYVYFAKPDSRDVYVIWLNADLYSKEEIIKFAESVRFTEQAFQNKR